MIPLVLVGATLVTYGQIVTHDFTFWDDQITLHRNPHFTPPTLSSVLWYWGHDENGMYSPVVYSVWGTLAFIAYRDPPTATGMRLDPMVFHAAALVVHCATTLLVFNLLRLLIRRDLAALAGALLFALHPLQVEVVAWATGMKEALCGMFAVAALWQYVLFASADNAQPPRPGRWRHYAATALAINLGALSNPLATMTPLLAAVIDYWMLGRPSRRVIQAVAPLALLVLPWMIVSKLVQPASTLVPPSLWMRPPIAADALAFYLYKLFAPIHLALDYARRPAVAWAHGWLLWTWLVPVAVALLIYLVHKGRRWLVAGGLLMLAGLAPVLGLVTFEFQQFSTVADRYMHLALLGPALALAAWLATPGRRTWCYAGAGVVLALLGGRAALQAGYWHDDLTLWFHSAELSPESFLSQSNLACGLDQLGPAWLDVAIPYYQRGVDLNPDFLGGQDNLAMALMRKGRTEDAIFHMRETLRIEETWHLPQRPEMAESRYALGILLLRQNHPAQAEEMFRRALRINPQNAEAAAGLATAHARAATQPGRVHLDAD